jgi:hypothetical protein
MARHHVRQAGLLAPALLACPCYCCFCSHVLCLPALLLLLLLAFAVLACRCCCCCFCSHLLFLPALLLLALLTSALLVCPCYHCFQPKKVASRKGFGATVCIHPTESNMSVRLEAYLPEQLRRCYVAGLGGKDFGMFTCQQADSPLVLAEVIWREKAVPEGELDAAAARGAQRTAEKHVCSSTERLAEEAKQLGAWSVHKAAAPVAQVVAGQQAAAAAGGYGGHGEAAGVPA